MSAVLENFSRRAAGVVPAASHHVGKNGLDAPAYFSGHGLQNVLCLRGGIDAWAQEVDATMRRYKLG